MRRILTIIYLLAAILMVSCSPDGDATVGPEHNIMTEPEATTTYEGLWRVGNYEAGKGRIKVYPSAIDLGNVPCAAVLRMVLTHNNVECADTARCLAMTENIGYTDQAEFLRLDVNRWETAATIDGTALKARMAFPQVLSSTVSDMPYAVYSRLSRSFTLMFPLVRVDLFDASGNVVQTLPSDLLITFTTTSIVK